MISISCFDEINQKIEKKSDWKEKSVFYACNEEICEF